MMSDETDPAPSPTHYDIARGILASVVNSSKAPTRHERLEVAQLAVALAVVDELRALRTEFVTKNQRGPRCSYHATRNPVSEP